MENRHVHVGSYRTREVQLLLLLRTMQRVQTNEPSVWQKRVSLSPYPIKSRH